MHGTWIYYQPIYKVQTANIFLKLFVSLSKMEEEKKIDSTVTTAREQPRRLWETSLRILALGLTTVASIIMAVNKETQMVDVKLSSSLPALPVLVHAKSFYSSAFL